MMMFRGMREACDLFLLFVFGYDRTSWDCWCSVFVFPVASCGPRTVFEPDAEFDCERKSCCFLSSGVISRIKAALLTVDCSSPSCTVIDLFSRISFSSLKRIYLMASVL